MPAGGMCWLVRKGYCRSTCGYCGTNMSTATCQEDPHAAAQAASDANPGGCTGGCADGGCLVANEPTAPSSGLWVLRLSHRRLLPCRHVPCTQHPLAPGCACPCHAAPITSAGSSASGTAIAQSVSPAPASGIATASAAAQAASSADSNPVRAHSCACAWCAAAGQPCMQPACRSWHGSGWQSVAEPPVLLDIAAVPCWRCWRCWHPGRRR